MNQYRLLRLYGIPIQILIWNYKCSIQFILVQNGGLSVRRNANKPLQFRSVSCRIAFIAHFTILKQHIDSSLIIIWDSMVTIFVNHNSQWDQDQRIQWGARVSTNKEMVKLIDCLAIKALRTRFWGERPDLNVQTFGKLPGLEQTLFWTSRPLEPLSEDSG